MTKFVVDFDSSEFKEAVKISIQERIKEITANEIEAIIQKTMEVKFGRVAKRIEELTDEKIDKMIHDEMKQRIEAYFTSRYYGGNSDFGKIAEKVLREMLSKILDS